MTEPWCQNNARILLTDSEREIEREKERDREILKGKCSLYVSDLEGLRAAHAAKNVINFLCVDLIIIPEIHCTPDQKIEIENFTVFQLNRPQNINARRGSGGIAIAINNLLLESHEIISVYTHGCDGQIGIKLKNKFNDFIVGILALYLSPDNYKYGRDAEEFFNNATVIWQDLSDSDLLIGAGDVNSRTKMLLDYVPDVDGSLIPPRSNPDNVKNAHAESFLSFLKDNN